MPEQYDRTNTISVNRNDKGDNENRPDFKADINIGGVRYFASLWQREGQYGTFLSGPVEKADDKYQPGAGEPQEAAQDASEGDPKQGSYF